MLITQTSGSLTLSPTEHRLVTVLKENPTYESIVDR